jgi:hypothetical protein
MEKLLKVFACRWSIDSKVKPLPLLIMKVMESATAAFKTLELPAPRGGKCAN